MRHNIHSPNTDADQRSPDPLRGSGHIKAIAAQDVQPIKKTQGSMLIRQLATQDFNDAAWSSGVDQALDDHRDRFLKLRTRSGNEADEVGKLNKITMNTYAAQHHLAQRLSDLEKLFQASDVVRGHAPAQADPSTIQHCRKPRSAQHPHEDGQSVGGSLYSRGSVAGICDKSCRDRQPLGATTTHGARLLRLTSSSPGHPSRVIVQWGGRTLQRNKGGRDGIGSSVYVCRPGVSTRIRVWTGSTAAMGICAGQGLGKLRHLNPQSFRYLNP